jgi:hypothetical protein
MKNFNLMYNSGSAKYIVNFHDGVKKHNDGSDFYNKAIFKNKIKFIDFQKQLYKDGYVNEDDTSGKRCYFITG